MENHPWPRKMTAEEIRQKIAEWSEKWETSGDVAHEIFAVCKRVRKVIHSESVGLVTKIETWAERTLCTRDKCSVEYWDKMERDHPIAHYNHNGHFCGTVADRGDVPVTYNAFFIINPEQFRIKNDFKDCITLEDIFVPWKTGDKIMLKNRKKPEPKPNPEPETQLSIIKPYVNKKGKSHMAHFTPSGKYLGPVSKKGKVPLVL
jgi:hypothetical protein